MKPARLEIRTRPNMMTSKYVSRTRKERKRIRSYLYKKEESDPPTARACTFFKKIEGINRTKWGWERIPNSGTNHINAMQLIVIGTEWNDKVTSPTSRIMMRRHKSRNKIK